MKLNKDNIHEIINEMTLVEKIHLCVGGKGFQTLEIERLGIPSLNLYDGHNGIVLTQMFGAIIPKVIKNMPKDEGSLRFMSDGIIKILFAIGKTLGQNAIYDLLRKEMSKEQMEQLPPDIQAFCTSFMANIDKVLPNGLPTCFPSGMAMGATWNPNLINQVGQAVGMEAENFQVDVLLGPNVNIHRDPLGGRNFESYSEDPYLSSKITVDYINGLQIANVAACVKHFACNNQETNRHEINEIISRRALEEIYLPSFKAAVTEAKSKTLMTAYNFVNGKACSENDFLLTDVLRNRWNFNGVVVSDWNGVYNKVPALNAGSDLEMPGPTDQSEIISAVEDGSIPIHKIDERVRRMLELIVSSRHFNESNIKYDKKEAQQISYSAAKEAMVLLRNKNSVLPIKDADVKIALFGQGAIDSLATGEGSAGVSTDYIVSSKQGLEKYYKNITYYSDDSLLDEISTLNNYAVIHINKSTGEGKDLEDMRISKFDSEMIMNISSFFKTKGKKTIVLLNVCGPVEMESWSKNVDAILLLWYPGQELGRAVCEILNGSVNPSGKLPITFPVKYLDTPTAHSFPGEHLVTQYGEGLFVGYRYYDYKNIEPAYEFGFGLSYADYEYTDISFSSDKFNFENDDSVTITVDITNTSKVDGMETAQLYINHMNPRYKRPIRELKGFRKVDVSANSTVKVSFNLSRKEFSYYDSSMDEWITEPGEYLIEVGSSSRDIKQCKSITLVGKNPYALSLDTTLKEVFASDSSRAIVSKHIPQQLLDLPGIHIELIYHPELSLKDAWNKYFVAAFKNAGLNETMIEEKLISLQEDLSNQE